MPPSRDEAQGNTGQRDCGRASRDTVRYFAVQSDFGGRHPIAAPLMNANVGTLSSLNRLKTRWPSLP